MSGSGTLGSIKGTIQIDYDGAGIAKANKDLDGVKTKGNAAGVSIDRVGTRLALAGTLIAGGFALAVKSAATFEQTLSDIKAVTGATTADMERVRQKALQLGKDTQFSASEAAQAMTELAKAGIAIPDIMNGAADATVALAAAGGVALPEAATIASNAMNQFNLKAKDMPKIADLIAGAANASAIDVHDFGMSIAQSGAVAHLAGLSFRDTATAIALMGNAGIKGSDAGTSLKTFLQNLIPVTKDQIELSKKLGLITKSGANAFFDASGNVKSLAEVSQVLQNATRGLSKEQQLAALQTLFGSDAIRAAAVLANNGAAGFNTLAASMAKVSAADVAKTKMDNFRGSIEQMKGSIETAGIQIGSAFLPQLRALVDNLTKAVNWFGGLSKGTQTMAIDALAGTAAFLLLGGAVIKTVAFFKGLSAAITIIKAFTIWSNIAKVATLAWTAVQWLLNAAFIASPIGWIVLAIGLLVAVFILLWTHSSAFRNFFIGMWKDIWGFLKVVGAWFAGPFKNFFVQLWQQFITDVQRVRAVVSAVFGFFAPLFTAVFGLVVSIVKTAWSIITAIFAVAVALITPIIRAISTVVSWMATGIKLEIQGLKIIWDLVWFAIRTTIQAVWGFIGPYVMTSITLMSAIIRGVLSGISAVWSVVWNIIRGVAAGVWAVIVSIVRFGVNAIINVINGIRVIVDRVRAFFNSLRDAASGGVGSLIAFVAAIPGRILGVLGNLGGLLVSKGRDLVQGLVNGISQMAGRIRDALVGLLPGPLKQFAGMLGLASPSKLFKRWGIFTIQGFINGVISMERRLRDALTRVASVATTPVVVTGNVDTSAFTGTSGTFPRPPTPPPGGAMTTNINTTVNAPAPLVNPQDLATFTVRKVVTALTTNATPVAA